MKNFLIGAMIGVVLVVFGTLTLDVVHAKPNIDRVVTADKVQCKSIEVQEFTLKDKAGNSRISMLVDETDNRAILFVQSAINNGQPQIYIEVCGDHCAIGLGDPRQKGCPLALVVDKDGEAHVQLIEGPEYKDISITTLKRKTLERLLKAAGKVEKTITEQEQAKPDSSEWDNDEWADEDDNGKEEDPRPPKKHPTDGMTWQEEVRYYSGRIQG